MSVMRWAMAENITATISTTTKRKLLKADHLHDELEEDEDMELPPPSPPRRYDYMTDPFTSCTRSESSTPLNSKMDLRNRVDSPPHHREFLILPFFFFLYTFIHPSVSASLT